MLDIDFPTKKELEEEIKSNKTEKLKIHSEVLSKIVEDYKKDLKCGLSKKSDFEFCIYESTRCNDLLTRLDLDFKVLEDLFEKFLKEKGYLQFKVTILKHIAPVERTADPYYQVKFKYCWRYYCFWNC